MVGIEQGHSFPMLPAPLAPTQGLLTKAMGSPCPTIWGALGHLWGTARPGAGLCAWLCPPVTVSCSGSPWLEGDARSPPSLSPPAAPP